MDQLFKDDAMTEAAQAVYEGLKKKVPFVSVTKSTLGGPGRGALMLTFSLDPREQWANRILQNSRYSNLDIGQDGVVVNFSGNNPKMRKFQATTIDEVVRKIGIYIDKISSMTASARVAMELLALAQSLRAGEHVEPVIIRMEHPGGTVSLDAMIRDLENTLAVVRKWKGTGAFQVKSDYGGDSWYPQWK